MTPYYSEPSLELYCGDALDTLAQLPVESVQTCVTSPPYFGLRDYGVAGQIGLESTPDEYVSKIVAVFAGVRRVLKDDGVLWVNIGDCYNAQPGQRKTTDKAGPKQQTNGGSPGAPSRSVDRLKPKDLIGMPWMIAFALRADGWYLRGDHIWAKPNGMPESVADRPTRSHEYVFLLSKDSKYFYNSESVRTAPKASSITRLKQDVENQLGSDRANGGEKTNGTMKAVSRKSDKLRGHSRRHDGLNDRWDQMEKSEQMIDGANLRSVWWIPPAQCSASHFAVMPPRVAEICILAGSRPGDTVLDPFNGSGTTGDVARKFGRRYLGIELNPKYCDLTIDRLRQQVLFGSEAAMPP